MQIAWLVSRAALAAVIHGGHANGLTAASGFPGRVRILSLAGAVLTLASAMAAAPVHADDDVKFRSSVWLGVSYPAVASLSVGTVLPLGTHPLSFGPRADLELGVGAGSLTLGLYMPLGHSLYAMNVRGGVLRTWLWSAGEEPNETLPGGMMELILLGHMAAKIGIGHFKDKDGNENVTYGALSLGW